MVAAYVLVSVEPGKNEPVVSRLRGMPGVKQAHPCWGKPDIFAFVEVESEVALAQTVLTDIQSIAGVRDTETHIVVAL
jgi:DNA-binding Lrp family transcriptional regulator